MATLSEAKAIVDRIAQDLETVLGIASDLLPTAAPQIEAAMAAVALIDFGVQTIEPESPEEIEQKEKMGVWPTGSIFGDDG